MSPEGVELLSAEGTGGPSAPARATPQRGRRRFLILVAAAALVGLAGGFVLTEFLGRAPSPVEGMPAELAGLPLNHRFDGAEALREIARLHGKGIRMKAATVAHYEARGIVAMLYVSESYLGFSADRQLQAMTAGMEKGNSPFSRPRAFQQGGRKIYSTFGQGQAHFYYRNGRKVIWLAADDPVAFPALRATLATIR